MCILQAILMQFIECQNTSIQLLHLLSYRMNHFLINLNFQLDVGSFDLRFQFQFKISNEITKFHINLQNSLLETSVSLFDEWDKVIQALLWKISLTEFPFGNWNFYLKFQSSNRSLE